MKGDGGERGFVELGWLTVPVARTAPRVGLFKDVVSLTSLAKVNSV